MVACSTNDVTPDDKIKLIYNATTVHFDGTIEEINGQSVLVSVIEGFILNSGDKVIVDLSVDPEKPFEIGDKVRIKYVGTVRESYPLQIGPLSIEKIN